MPANSSTENVSNGPAAAAARVDEFVQAARDMQQRCLTSDSEKISLRGAIYRTLTAKSQQAELFE